MAPSLRFALPSAAAAPPRAPKARAFDDADEPAPLAPRAAAPVSKAVQRQHADAADVDASTFDYDGVYDKMKQIERARQQAKKEQDSERKPKYMHQFFEAAETRERDPCAPRPRGSSASGPRRATRSATRRRSSRPRTRHSRRRGNVPRKKSACARRARAADPAA